MVGRPREFDEEQVLEAAMRAFWANGYESTSLSDLVSVTGLHKGSLYQVFGDKFSVELQLRTFMNAEPADALFAIEHDDYLQLQLSWYY